MTIGERLRELRIDHDMNQAQIATILGTAQNYYASYELNKRQFPTRHLIAIAKYYGVSADYILGLPKGLKWPR